MSDSRSRLYDAASRVYCKYGAVSDWTEWRDLYDALKAYDIAEGLSGIRRQDLADAFARASSDNAVLRYRVEMLTNELEELRRNTRG